jgi:hypothetical protein
MNEIYLRRLGKVYVKKGAAHGQHALVATMQKEVEAFGYVFAPELIERLGTLAPLAMSDFLHDLLRVLRRLTGAHHVHQPLYPGFPLQVVEASEATLYLNAVMHYVTLRRPTPDQPMPERPPLLHRREPRVIGLGTLEEFEAIFQRLTLAKASLSPQDRGDLAWFVRQYRHRIYDLLPAQVPFKENLAVLGALLYRHAGGPLASAFLHAQLRTATDVLRWVVALNDGDPSLAQPCRFASMRRALRRDVLGLLEPMPALVPDMFRHAERWKRVGERLHPGEHAQRFPHACAGFAQVRAGRRPATFAAKVEEYLRLGDISTAAALLADRPGELARRLDQLLRRGADVEGVLELFRKTAGRVATPVLLQLLSHFRRLPMVDALRVFFPKGGEAKLFALRERRPVLAPDVAGLAAGIAEAALMQRFARLAALGRCYVDPALADYAVPLAQRAMSRSLRTLARGSRLPLPATRFVRLFLWWKNGRHRTDIDLSAAFFGADFKFMDLVAYHNLRNYGGYHSGDIVDAPQGAAEFIDLDLPRLRERGVRFVVVSLNSFTQQPYCELPECFAGWMARSDANSGEIFEPRTVEDRIDIASAACMCIPFVLDLETQKVLWSDMSYSIGLGWNNTINNLSGVSLILRAMADWHRADLHTLFTLHARARGELVEQAEAAETVFAVDQGITPFELDRIRAEFI